MLIIDDSVEIKLAMKHSVMKDEVMQCFANRDLRRNYLGDKRDRNQTWPPTLWFIARTDSNRELKVVFLSLKDGNILLKTAHEPNDMEKRIYLKHSQRNRRYHELRNRNRHPNTSNNSTGGGVLERHKYRR